MSRKRLSYSQRQARKETKKIIFGTIVAIPAVAVVLMWGFAFGQIAAQH